MDGHRHDYPLDRSRLLASTGLHTWDMEASAAPLRVTFSDIGRPSAPASAEPAALSAYHNRYLQAQLPLNAGSGFPYLGSMLANSLPAPAASPFRAPASGMTSLRQFWPPTPPPDGYSRYGVNGNVYPLYPPVASLPASSDNGPFAVHGMFSRLPPHSRYPHLLDSHKETNFFPSGLSLGSPLTPANQLSHVTSLPAFTPTLDRQAYGHLNMKGAEIGQRIVGNEEDRLQRTDSVLDIFSKQDASSRHSTLEQVRLNSIIDGAESQVVRIEKTKDISPCEIRKSASLLGKDKSSEIKPLKKNDERNREKKINHSLEDKNANCTSSGSTVIGHCIPQPQSVMSVLPEGSVKVTVSNVTKPACSLCAANVICVNSDSRSQNFKKNVHDCQNSNTKMGDNEMSFVAARTYENCNVAMVTAVTASPVSTTTTLSFSYNHMAGPSTTTASQLKHHVSSVPSPSHNSVYSSGPQSFHSAPPNKHSLQHSPSRSSSCCCSSLHMIALNSNKTLIEAGQLKECDMVASRMPKINTLSLPTKTQMLDNSKDSVISLSLGPQDGNKENVLNPGGLHRTGKGTHHYSVAFPGTDSSTLFSSLAESEVETAKPSHYNGTSPCSSCSTSTKISTSKPPIICSIKEQPNMNASKKLESEMVHVKQENDERRYSCQFEKAANQLNETRNVSHTQEELHAINLTMERKIPKVEPSDPPCCNQNSCSFANSSSMKALTKSSPCFISSESLVALSNMASSEPSEGTLCKSFSELSQQSTSVSLSYSTSADSLHRTSRPNGMHKAQRHLSSSSSTSSSPPIGCAIPLKNTSSHYSRAFSISKNEAANIAPTSCHGSIPVPVVLPPAQHSVKCSDSKEGQVTSCPNVLPTSTLSSSVIIPSTVNSSIPVGIAVAQQRQDRQTPQSIGKHGISLISTTSNISLPTMRATSALLNGINGRDEAQRDQQSSPEKPLCSAQSLSGENNLVLVSQGSNPSVSQWEPEATRNTHPWATHGPVVTPAVWISQGAYVSPPGPTTAPVPTIPVTSLDPSGPLPSGGYQLARDSLTGQILLIPTANVELVDRTGLWPAFTHSSGSTLRLVGQQQSQFPQQLVPQIVENEQVQEIQSPPQRNETDEGRNSNLLPELKEKDNQFINVHVKQEPKDLPVDTPPPSVVTEIPVIPAQSFSYSSFSPPTAPPNLSYFYESSSIVQLDDNQVTTNVQAESGKRSQGTSPLNSFTPSPPLSSGTEQAVQVSDGAPEDGEDSDFSDCVSHQYDCEITQVKLSTHGSSITTATQVDMDSHINSDDNDFEEKSRNVSDSANQTDIFDEAPKEKGDSDIEATDSKQEVSDISKDCSKLPEETPLPRLSEEKDKGNLTSKAEHAPVISAKSKPVMEFIDHHGLNLLVDSIEEFASREQKVAHKDDHILSSSPEVLNKPNEEPHLKEEAPHLKQSLEQKQHDIDILENMCLSPKRQKLQTKSVKHSEFPNIDPSCTDGLGLLCALAEQRFLEEAMNGQSNMVSQSQDNENDQDDDSIQSMDINFNHPSKKEFSTPDRKIIAPSSKSSPTHSLGSPLRLGSSTDSMDPAELDMRMRLAELQRKYKEKQRELAKLQPKKEKEDADKVQIKRGPGRPRKRRFLGSVNSRNTELVPLVNSASYSSSDSSFSSDGPSQMYKESEVKLSEKTKKVLSVENEPSATDVHYLRRKLDHVDSLNKGQLNRKVSIKRAPSRGSACRKWNSKLAKTQVKSTTPSHLSRLKKLSKPSRLCTSRKPSQRSSTRRAVQTANLRKPFLQSASKKSSWQMTSHDKNTRSMMAKKPSRTGTARKPVNRICHRSHHISSTRKLPSKNVNVRNPSKQYNAKQFLPLNNFEKTSHEGKSNKSIFLTESSDNISELSCEENKSPYKSKRNSPIKNLISTENQSSCSGLKKRLRAGTLNKSSASSGKIPCPAIPKRTLRLSAHRNEGGASKKILCISRAESDKEKMHNEAESLTSSDDSGGVFERETLDQEVSSSKKRKPGNPKKHSPLKSEGVTETIVAKQPKNLIYKTSIQAVSTARISMKEMELEELDTRIPNFDEDAWNRRRSERIFLHEAGTSTGFPSCHEISASAKQDNISPPHLEPIEDTDPVVWKSENKILKANSNPVETIKSKKKSKREFPHKKLKSKESRKQIKDRSVPDELFTALRKCCLSEGNVGGILPDSEVFDSSHSDGENIPLSALIEQPSNTGLRSCSLTPQDLQDKLRVLTSDNDLYYAGYITAIQAPDVYGIILDGERGNRPHIYSREEILNEVILELKPESVQQLPEGTRVCAYWSQQYRCLYPGTVARSLSPNSSPEKLVFVEFDDGDSGRIPIDDIRLLPSNSQTTYGNSNSQLSNKSSIPKMENGNIQQNVIDANNLESKEKLKIRKNKREMKTAKQNFESDSVSGLPTNHHENKVHLVSPSGELDLNIAWNPSLMKHNHSLHSPARSPRADRSAHIDSSKGKEKNSSKKKSKKKNESKSKSKDKNCERIPVGEGMLGNYGDYIPNKPKKHKKRKDEHKHRHHHHHHRCHHHHHHKKRKHGKKGLLNSSDRHRHSHASKNAVLTASNSVPSINELSAFSDALKFASSHLTGFSPQSVTENQKETCLVKNPSSLQSIDSHKKASKQTEINSNKSVPTELNRLDGSASLHFEASIKGAKTSDSFEAEERQKEKKSEEALCENKDQKEMKKEKLPPAEESKVPDCFPTPKLWQWCGKSFRRPGSRGKGKKYYKAVVQGKETIQVGDCAVFLSTSRNHLPYVGHIETMWQSWGGNMVVRVKWFYHPEETKAISQISDLKQGALFQSTHVDENDIQTISHKCEVMSWKEFKNKMEREDNKQNSDLNNDMYYLAGTYDPTVGSVTLEPGIS